MSPFSPGAPGFLGAQGRVSPTGRGGVKQEVGGDIENNEGGVRERITAL